MINSKPIKYKNTKQLCEFLFISAIACVIYFLWGIYSLYIDKIVYDISIPDDNFIVKAIIAFFQSMILQVSIILVAICSICCWGPLDKVFIQNKEQANYCHGILMILLTIPIFCLYVGIYNLECYLQNVDAPEIFSNNSLTYLLAGFLKPFPAIVIQSYSLYLDEKDKKNSSKVFSDTKFNNIKLEDNGNVV